MLFNSSEILQKSWSDYVKNWHHWAVFSLLIFMPSFVLLLSGSFGGYLNMYFPATTAVTNIIILILVVVSAVFGFWSSIALIRSGGRFIQNNATDTWKENYAFTLKQLWPSFGASFLAGLAILFGILLFLIPGIIFAVWYFFAVYGVVINGDSIMKGLSDSKKLVAGRWWSVAWRIFVPSFLIGVAGMVIKTTLVFFVDFLPLNETSIAVVENIVTGVVSALASPLTTLAGLHLYFNLRDNPFREPPGLRATGPPVK